MNITYRELNEDDYKNIEITFGDILNKYNVSNFKDKATNYGAFDNDRLVGIISIVILPLLEPLEGEEAFINHIEVVEDYRRNGIGTNLLKLAEDWTKEKHLFQLRAWSGKNTVEAINMANKQKYVMSQSIIYDINAPLYTERKYVFGYNWAKRFD